MSTSSITVQVPKTLWEASLAARGYTSLSSRIREGLDLWVRTGSITPPGVTDGEVVALAEQPGEAVIRTIELPRSLRDVVNASAARGGISTAAAVRRVLAGLVLGAERTALTH